MRPLPLISARIATSLALLGPGSIAVAAPPDPSESTAPAIDEVRLINGGFVKGELVELMPGEYVVIETTTGETRRFEWSEVASVEHGGSTAAPASNPTPTSAVEGQPYVHIVMPGPHPMTLQRVADRVVTNGVNGATSVGVAFSPVCESPCDRLVSNPGAEFFLSGAKYTKSRTFRLGSARAYELRVEPRKKGVFIAGAVLLALGPAAAVLVASLPFITPMQHKDAVANWAIAGFIAADVLVGGITLLAFGRTRVEVLPRTEPAPR